jgi:hypothetical protein
MSISVIQWPAVLECACCGYAMRAEPRTHAARDVIITCANSRCEQYEKRLVVKPQILDCEELPA